MSSHPLDNVPPGIRLSGGRPDRGPITITPEQLAETRREAARIRALEGPNPRLEDLLDPDQIAIALAAVDALDAGKRLAPAVGAVKAAREAAGLSLAEVAAKARLPEETLGRLEAGTLAEPTWQTLDRYARAVGLTLTLTATPAGGPPH